MLLDTDMTMTNSPDASPSQVHNTIKRIENKIVVCGNNENVQQQQPQYHYNRFYLQDQENRSERFKPVRSLNVINQSCSIPFNIPIQTNRAFNRKIQRTLSNIAPLQSVESNAFGSKENMVVKEQHQQFNPYADENDSATKFQLSKSIDNRCNINDSTSMQVDTAMMNNTLNRTRLFGNDRTNLPLMQIDRLQFSNRPQNVINLRRENFHTFNISNNMILRNSNTRMLETSQNSQFIQENPVMFRNYDLNDEYWLNFE